jgi:hypothetical protein
MHMHGAFGDFAEVSGPFGVFEDDLLIEFFEFVVHGGNKGARKKAGRDKACGEASEDGSSSGFTEGAKAKDPDVPVFPKTPPRTPRLRVRMTFL